VAAQVGAGTASTADERPSMTTSTLRRWPPREPIANDYQKSDFTILPLASDPEHDRSFILENHPRSQTIHDSACSNSQQRFLFSPQAHIF